MGTRFVRLLGWTALCGVIALCGCAPDLHDTVYSQLAKADKGWSGLSDYQRGKRYLQVGDYGLAIEAFGADVQREPNSVNSLNGLAIAYGRIGRSDVAEQYFARALAVEPQSPVTLSNLAYLHITKGDTRTAGDLLERAKATLTPATKIKTPELVAAVVLNNEALLRAIYAGQEDAKAAQPVRATPVIEKINDREWVFHGTREADAALQPVTREPVAAQKDAGAVAASLEIVNASGRSRLAHRVGQYMSERGFTVDHLRNAERFGRAQSILFCQHGARPAAETIAESLQPLRVRIVELRTEGKKVELVAGRDLDDFGAQMASGRKIVEQVAAR